MSQTKKHEGFGNVSPPSGQPWPLKKKLLVNLLPFSSLLRSFPLKNSNICVPVLEMLLLLVRELSVNL